MEPLPLEVGEAPRHRVDVVTARDIGVARKERVSTKTGWSSPRFATYLPAPLLQYTLRTCSAVAHVNLDRKDKDPSTFLFEVVAWHSPFEQ